MKRSWIAQITRRRALVAGLGTAVSVVTLLSLRAPRFWRAIVVLLVPPVLALLLMSPGSLLDTGLNFSFADTTPMNSDADMLATGGG